MACCNLWVLCIDRGESFESARDLCFFIVKELGKAFSIIHIVLAEYHALLKLKEFLYAELCTYHVEGSLAKQAFAKYVGAISIPDYGQLKHVSSLLDEELEEGRRNKLQAGGREQQTEVEHHRHERYAWSSLW